MNRDLATLAGDPKLAQDASAYFHTLGTWLDAGPELGLLNEAAAIALTREFRSFHPVVQGLHGILLDDPDTSNHHVLLGHEAVSGAIFYLAHDGDSRIVFDGLDSFLAAAREAAASGTAIEDQHPDHACILRDQPALESLIASLRPTPHYEDTAPVLIASLDLTDVEFLSALVRDPDVYVAEAVLRAIAARPSATLLPIVDAGARHDHVMVRNAADAARCRIAACGDAGISRED
ncbi:hypothetical protein ACSBM8_00710 [Sphingomonas sp. ASY06-1R]|uniref:hypothetical protein n=1 Tax=Sphingomonas sp. ASY06-1R TaxID=3445771 RepID=UPI003FA210FD